jgi:lipoprotein-anchoring transpeptidase ErfK/SrfK
MRLSTPIICLLALVAAGCMAPPPVQTNRWDEVAVRLSDRPSLPAVEDADDTERLPDHGPKPMLTDAVNEAAPETAKAAEDTDTAETAETAQTPDVAAEAPVSPFATADYSHYEKDLAEVMKQVLKPVKVAGGETLSKIAKAHGTTWELLTRVNGISDPRRIRLGQSVQVPVAPIRVEVDKETFKMSVFVGDVMVKQYPVCVGTEATPTPDGEFKVKRKAKNPSWSLDGQYAAPNSPDNPAGSRWIDLGNRYGIHGTNEPNSVGKRASQGCVRMLNDDVEEVYDLLVDGALVVLK